MIIQCGPLTGRNYTRTATAIENTELVVWSRGALDRLLRNRPDLRQQLLTVLGERMAENRKIAKALVIRDEQPSQQVNVIRGSMRNVSSLAQDA
jgi:CRP-like cAMP-binding protein